MKVAFFSVQAYDREYFNRFNPGHNLSFFETRLTVQTAGLATDADVVCVFVNDQLDEAVIGKLKKAGVKMIALRCAGFNNVDIIAARKAGIHVVRVPAYSPYAVAEHAVAMILTLNRKTNKAYNRIREGNFSLDGLVGFDLHGKTVGIIGTGNIGKVFARIMMGFGCRVLAFDLVANRSLEEFGVEFCSLHELLQESDIVSLHCPLNEQTYHIVSDQTIAMMKRGVMLINTSRGGLINTVHVIEAIKTGHIGYLGIDVYEQEEALFFQNLSGEIIRDDDMMRLISFPNVLITSHQGFFTAEALTQIAETTYRNINELESGSTLANAL